MSETSRRAGSGSDRYRTLFELGHGGTADVLLAVAADPDPLRKPFVVKQLCAVHAHDPEFRAMFMAEARLSVRLDHPHVVQVYEVLERDGVPVILMEYIEGQTLDAVLSLPAPPLPLALHLRILADVLSGLHYSHELLDLDQRPLNVVHRDVSPHNVMVSYEGVVKVLDFGIAKLSGSTIDTAAGVVKGKLHYMPPEQVAGERVDRRADLFAVGVMLWQALSGSKLWQGLPDAVVIKRILSGEIPKPAHPTSPVPPELEAICMKALAVDREQRYQTALEFEQALEAYLLEFAPHASARELGRFVAERFAQARRALDERIANELDHEWSDRVRGSRNARTEPPALTGSRAARAPGEPPRSRLWIGAVASVALGVLILLWGLRPRTPLIPERGSTALQASAPPHSPSVAIEASAPLAPPPLHETVRPQPSATLHVPAPAPPASAGEAAATAAPPRVVRQHAPAPAAPPAASSAPAALDLCEPPYFLDERGIKKFRPECI